jgi:hypothetical protein
MEIAGRLAVGRRAGLEDQPALDAVGVGQLEGQTRLAHARLAHDRDHLTLALLGPVDRSAELVGFLGSTHEGGEPAHRCGLESRTDDADPGELVDLNGAR